MKIIILAAGRGSRLLHLTDSIPKCLVSLANHSLLDRCLYSLEQANIKQEDIVIVTGYKKEQIEQKVKVKTLHNAMWNQGNMVRSLLEAKQYLINETCLVVYSDIVFSANVITKVLNTTQDLVLPSYTHFWELWEQRCDNPFEDLESFEFDSNMLLTDIGQRVTTKDRIQGQFMGIIKFTPNSWANTQKILDTMTDEQILKLDCTSLLQKLIAAKQQITVLPTNDLWLECDSVDDIKLYEKLFSKELSIIK